MTEQASWPWADSHAPEARSVLLAGSICLRQLRQPAGALANVQATLRDADVTVAHLEQLFADCTPPTPLTAAGISAMSCACAVGHSAATVVATVDHLQRAGIAIAGIGRNTSEARAPAVLVAGGLRVGLLAVAALPRPALHAAGERRPGVACVESTATHGGDADGDAAADDARPRPLELATLARDIAALRTHVDLLLVACRW